MILTLYRALGWVIGPAIRAFLKHRIAIGKEDPARLKEREGYASVPRPKGQLVWFHAASVGEMISVLSVIVALKERKPETTVLVTSGTVTSAQMAARRLPDGCIHQYVPADIPPWVTRFLEHWRPDAAFWVESELWPGLVTATRKRGIPMILLNARISLTSFKRWRRLPFLRRPVFGAFDLVLARSDLAAERYGALGVKEVHATGDLKLSAPPLPVDAEELARLKAQIDGRPVFLAASTHDGEEQAVLLAQQAAFKNEPELLTIIVPRHPQRGEEVFLHFASTSYETGQRSKGDEITPKTVFYVADTMGELGLFYSVADVSFIGGSLTPRGGQNPLEAAPFNTAILMGPDRRNNLRPAEVLDQAQALLVVDTTDELKNAVAGMFAHRDRIAFLTGNAKKVVLDGAAVLDSTLTMISPYIDGTAGGAGQEDEA